MDKTNIIFLISIIFGTLWITFTMTVLDDLFYRAVWKWVVFAIVAVAWILFFPQVF